MSEWDPLEEMRPHEYLLFKLRRWVSVGTVPEWVKTAEREYFDGYREKYGNRPYDQTKVFVGDSVKYRVTFEPALGGGVKPTYEVKLKLGAS